jgi:hypothetical protein
MRFPKGLLCGSSDTAAGKRDCFEHRPPKAEALPPSALSYSHQRSTAIPLRALLMLPVVLGVDAAVAPGRLVRVIWNDMDSCVFPKFTM